MATQGKTRGKAPIIQRHHISYEPEVTVDIYKAEHKILTLCQWYTKKRISTGFLRALGQIIVDNMDRAEEIKR